MTTFFVAGIPAPQGSKSYKGLRNGKPILVESSKAAGPWRKSITTQLRSEYRGTALEGPVHVELRFVMPRPVATPKRYTPPAIKQPDLDKLVRAVFDAVTASGVWRDDSQVTDLRTSKRLAEIGEQPGVEIRIVAGVQQEALL